MSDQEDVRQLVVDAVHGVTCGVGCTLEHTPDVEYEDGGIADAVLAALGDRALGSFWVGVQACIDVLDHRARELPAMGEAAQVLRRWREIQQGSGVSDRPSVEMLADVFKATCVGCNHTDSRCPGHAVDARAALEALAGAGRLLPEDPRAALDVIAEEVVGCDAALVDGAEVLTFGAIRRALSGRVGPWVPVPEEKP